MFPKKKNEHIERVLNNIGTIYERTNVERTVMDWKEWLYQEEYVLIHLEIIEMGKN